MTLEIDALTVSYDGVTVLDRVSAEIAAGRHVGLIGPNGSGKSTLLRCLYRALVPDSGTVRVDGADISAMPRKRTARLLSAVTQTESGVFGFTVAETVALGRYAHRDAGTAEAEAACRRAMAVTDVGDLADRSVLALSGGQRQRVVIARALAQQTPILLLDEPLNHLDARHQLDLLRHLKTGSQTTVMAIHDLNLAAQSCDRLILLDGGRVIADDVPARVLDPDLLESVYGIRFDLLPAPDGGTRLSFPL